MVEDHLYSEAPSLGSVAPKSKAQKMSEYCSPRQRLTTPEEKPLYATPTQEGKRRRKTASQEESLRSRSSSSIKVIISKFGKLHLYIIHKEVRYDFQFSRSTDADDVIQAFHNLFSKEDNKENVRALDPSIDLYCMEEISQKMINIEEVIKQAIKGLKEKGKGMHLTTLRIQQKEIATPQEFAPKESVAKIRSSTNEVEPGLVGLKNLRNTCFVNSVLQSLSNCNFFREHFQKHNFPSMLLSCEMKRLFQDMWSGSLHTLAPFSFLGCVEEKIQYEFGSEEDAHWFLQVLLQHLDEESSDEKRISQLFETKRIREYVCSNCQLSMKEPEARLTINTLAFPQTIEGTDRSSCTLEECLSIWNGENSIECSTCQGICSQKYSIANSPKILCFHFNRSRWTGKVIQRATRSGVKGKISTKVYFPIQFDIGTLQEKSLEPSNYSLTAVVVHDGLTPAAGHYFTYAFHLSKKKWYKFDDAQRPKEVSENTVLKANPFMLFYQRSI